MNIKQQEEVCDTGKVLDVQDDYAIVELENKDSCKNCGLVSFCNQNSNEKVHLKILNTKNVKKDDRVEIQIKPSIKLLSHFYIFILPLLVIILSYFFAKNVLHLSEDIVAILSFSSLILSYFIIKYINSIYKKRQTLKAQITRLLTPKTKG